MEGLGPEAGEEQVCSSESGDDSGQEDMSVLPLWFRIKSPLPGPEY